MNGPTQVCHRADSEPFQTFAVLPHRQDCAHVGRPRSPLTFSKADITSFGSADRYGGWKPVIRMRSVSAPHRWHDLLDVTTAWCVGKAPTISVNRTVPRTRSASTLSGRR
jgi:hypothetical protein